MGGIDRKSSIESEPRTLSMGQLQFARDAAMYVVNTRSTEEAMKIFTEGLEPVSSASMQNWNTNTTVVEEYHCSLGGLRDIASAPF